MRHRLLAMRELSFASPAWRLPLPARGERVGVRGRRRRRCREDCVPYAFDISEHFVIPETQDTVAAFDEPLITGRVTLVICVLAAVDFDDEPLLSTGKIDDIRTNRLLTHKFETAERPGAKISPELSFGTCRISSQLPSQTRLRYVCATHASRPPHPNPLPARGERELRAARLSASTPKRSDVNLGTADDALDHLTAQHRDRMSIAIIF